MGNHLMRFAVFIWLGFTNQVLAQPADYTQEFSPYFLAAIKTAESTPQNALKSLQTYHPTTAIEQAMQAYAYATAYAALDYPEKMHEHCLEGLQLLNPNQEPWLYHFLNVLMVDAQDRLGRGYQEVGSLQNSIDWAINNDHGELAAAALVQMSFLHIGVENYSKALELIQQAEKLAPEQGQLFDKTDVIAEMAAIYVYRNEFDLALPYFEKSYQKQKAENNILGMSIDLFEMGRANLEINKTELGIKQLYDALALSKQIDDIQGMAYANLELGIHYIEETQYDQAEKLLLTAKSHFNDAENKTMLFNTLVELSNVYIKTSQNDAAEKVLTAAKDILEVADIRYGEVTLKKQQASLSAATGRHQEAYELHLEADTIEDQIESKVSAEKLHEIRARYEIEAKEIKNQLLAKQNDMQALQIVKQKTFQKFLVLGLSAMLLVILLIFYLYLKAKRNRNQLHYLANFDGLTGLMNRSNTINTIREQLAKVDSHEIISLVMIDLDHFKDINDTFGHILGDKVLSLFGTYCQQWSKEAMAIGRLGGEEFMFSFVGQEETDVFQWIDELRLKTEQMKNDIDVPGLKVTMSAGICYSHGQHRFRDIFKCADVAMYEAKNNGRNQIITKRLN